MIDIVAELRVHDSSFMQCHAEPHGHAADEVGPGRWVILAAIGMSHTDLHPLPS
jgi:hypothetical protein